MIMQKPAKTVTMTLTPEEEQLIAELARERGLASPEEVLRALLHDAIEQDEALWDAQFQSSQDVLDRLADEALDDIRAGRTHDLDLSQL
jgi:hypothetical protein